MRGWYSPLTMSTSPSRFQSTNAICSAGLALNVLLLNLLFNFAGVNRYVANAIAIVAVTGWNYWLNRKLNWTPLAVIADQKDATKS